MIGGSKEKRLSSKQVVRSLLLSTGIAFTLLLYLEFKDAGCYIFETGQPGAFVSAGVLWILALTFFLLPWLGRVIFVFCLVITGLLWPNVDRMPVAAAQAGMVGKVKTAQELLEEQKREHPQDGYPLEIPSISADLGLEKYFKFEYTLIRPRKSGPAVDYVLKVTPIRRGCGFHLNLITSSDRVIHITYEDRPATRADPALAP